MANAFQRMLSRIGLQPRSRMDPRVRAKLEELGIDAVRSKFVWIMNVRTFGQQDDSEDLGDGVWASHRQIRQWLKKKTARESWWVRIGVIAALFAALFAFLAWRFPYG